MMEVTAQSTTAAATHSTSASSGTSSPRAPQGAGAPRSGGYRGGQQRGGSQGQGQGGRGGSGDRRGNGGGRGGRQEREPQEFEQTIVELARVTRVTEGGKRMRFRACVVIGDRKGRVGFGVAKGADVQLAVNKAVRQAKKNLVRVPIIRETIPYAVESKFAAARIMLKPAPAGSGIIAGGALRTVLEYAGVPNISSRILGSKSKINNVKAAFMALQDLGRLQQRHGSSKS